MSLFDINTLLKENTLIDELVVKPYSKETFMFQAIDSLRKFNESNILYNKEFYKSLNEATSKEEENKVFGDFYNKYNSILDKYINEVRTMIDRFSINLDNLADANNKLANDQEVLSCDKEFTYTIRKYKNLTASKYPRFNALAIYQKEFDYIGQMMEDLGPIATDIAKLEVLATVTNGFCNKMKNKWLEKCIEEITGEDDCEDLTCYAKILNDIFMDKEEDIVVNRGTIYAMREEITGYEKYKDAILAIGDKLITDFTYMSSNIGSLFYRNKDKVLSIRSDNKDVANRDYQLNTYGMNQLDIFMKSKANQVAQMCSLYVIALSVMIDSIISHITQCGDLLEKVKDEIERIDEPVTNDTASNISQGTIDPETEEPVIDDEDNNIEGGEEGLDDSDDESEDPGESMYEDEESEEPNFDLEEEPDGDEPAQEQAPQEPEEPEVEELPSNESYVDFEREVGLFEYAMYAMDTVLEQETMLHYVHTDILREEEQASNVTGYSTDDATFIEKIVITLQNIWGKFTNLFQTKTTQRAEFIKKNSAVIEGCNMNVGTGFKCTEYQKINLLGELVAKPLQYESMKDELANPETFFKEYYKGFAEKLTDGTSIKEAIKLTIIPDKEKMSTIANAKPLIEFCINFGNQFNDIQKSMKDVKNASVMAKSIAKTVKMTNTNNNATNKEPAGSGDAGSAEKTNTTGQQSESSMMYTSHEDYLKEATEITKPPEGVNQAGTSTDSPIKQVRNYFKVTTTVVSQRMTLSQTIFNDYFNILNGVLKANGKPTYTGKKEPTSTATNTNDNTPKEPEKK